MKLKRNETKAPTPRRKGQPPLREGRANLHPKGRRQLQEGQVANPPTVRRTGQTELQEGRANPNAKEDEPRPPPEGMMNSHNKKGGTNSHLQKDRPTPTIRRTGQTQSQEGGKPQPLEGRPTLHLKKEGQHEKMHNMKNQEKESYMNKYTT